MTEMNIRKSVKINMSRTSMIIDGPIDQDLISKLVVSLTINFNKTLPAIKDMPELSYLKLNHTSARSIINCPSLSILIINHSKLLKRLENLNDLFEFEGKLCTKLKYIKLPNLNDAAIKHCIQLHTLITPKIQTLQLVGCSKLKYVHVGEKIKVLKIHSCHLIRSLKFLQSPNIKLEYLRISDCAQLTELWGLHYCKLVVVSECHALHKIYDLSHIGSITIDNCSELTYIGQLDKIEHCSISRCDSIYILHKLNIFSASIEYCPKLNAIDNIFANKLIVRYCNRLVQLYINCKTTELILEECSQLTYIKFDKIRSQDMTTLEITLKGLFAFESISTWRATSLTIIDNPIIRAIDTIYDLKYLYIQSCSNLMHIQNMIIDIALEISNCLLLENIESIIGPETIKLVDLDNLTCLDLTMTFPREFCIENCFHLKTKIDGRNLKKLMLINTNIILVEDLSASAVIKTSNSGYLPDLETNQTYASEHTVVPEAEMLIEFNAHQCVSISKIVNYIRKQIAKKYIGRICAVIAENYCTICMDTIDKKSKFVTKCLHVFHENCISSWILEKNSCPLCNERHIFRPQDLIAMRNSNELMR